MPRTYASDRHLSSRVKRAARTCSCILVAVLLLSAAVGAQTAPAASSTTAARAPSKLTATPTFAPPPGSYTAPRLITIASATPGAQIRYTVDGSSPSRNNGTLYSGPLTLDRSVTVRAIAFARARKASFVARGVYTLVPPPPPPPPPPGLGGALLASTLVPQDGASSLGSGQSTLLVAADASSGAFRFSFSNLSGPLTSSHVHAPDGQILFDVDEAPLQPDGSRTWTFRDTGSWTRANILTALAAGQCYLNLHTARYPNGEIKGFLRPVTGSTTFTPPPPPPPLPPGNPDAPAAARFLRQATFGPTLAEIAALQARGYRDWIAEQLGLPTASHLAYVDALPPDDPARDDDDLSSYNARESIWKQMILGRDQLRQRVAFALSQLLVVSDRTDELYEVPTLAAYMDVLARNAFGSYRTLLEEVTLSPVMGAYLDMASNDKEDPATGRNPNENYARELLQLFSIGLYELHPDGTLKLGRDGLPIATYDQDTIRGFAKVFTGWTYAGQDHEQDWMFYYPNGDWRRPMEPWPEHHSSGPKLLLGGVTLPAGGTPEQDLRAAVDNVFRHPNVGPFVCRHLIQQLVTSNPSPAYVYRCGRTFADDGNGVRGNLEAVVAAILLDWEARSTDVLAQPGYGKAREPVLRFVGLLRALHAKPPADGRFHFYYLGDPAYGIGQMPLHSPTVFNFFEPTWAQPGTIAARGLVSPELKLVDEMTVFGMSNFLINLLFYGYDLDATTISLDWSELVAAAAVSDAALLDRLNLLFYAGGMSAQTRAAFAAALADPAFPTAQPDRVQTVLWLVSLTPEFVAGS